MLVNIKI